MSRNQRRNRRNKPGGSPNANQHHTEDRSAETVRHRSSTETKSSLKTTELIAYAATVLAIVMTALALDEDGRGGDDPFGAETAIRYITYLTIGYMIARGLAKSGSHENRVEHVSADDGDASAPVSDEVDAEDREDREVVDGVEQDREVSVPARVPSTDHAHAQAGTVDARP